MCPCEARGHADLVVLLATLRTKLGHTEKLLDAVGSDPELLILPFLHHLLSQFATNAGDLALELTDTGFAGVELNDGPHRLITKGDVHVGKSVLAALLGYQVAIGDRHLFQFRVAGNADDLETVFQRCRDPLKGVGGANKHDTRQIVVHVEVVIVKTVVLLWIENLEQRRRRVTAEVHRHLVDFVEEKYRVRCAGALETLNDLARQSANVGSTMTTNLSLITHTAERLTHELAPRSPSNGSSQ